MTVVEEDLALAVLGPGRTRILGGPGPFLSDHVERYGPLQPRRFARLVEDVRAAGLRGRGGAGFPTYIKMSAVLQSAGRGVFRRAPVIVANGTEGEPASSKDKVLLRVAPHLVLDGMVAAAAAIGAEQAILCIDRRDTEAIHAAQIALSERGRGDPVVFRLAEVPSRYVAGEETALVAWLNGGAAKPTFAPPRPSDRGVDGAPTLVDNVETLANIGLIARFGAAAYRQVGEDEEPGTALFTVRGGVSRPGIYEMPIGTPLAQLLETGRAGPARAVLVGGYFGTWLTPEEAGSAVLSSAGLRPFGASLGCGLVAVMPAGLCPLPEVSRVLHWLAANSAGQCGACVNGLPALAGAFDRAVAGDRSGRANAQLDRWSPMITGRGACKLPDGAVRFLESARRAFEVHIAEHRRSRPCRADPSAILPTPSLGGWR
jgi:NADH:ubiquinone oxidoreductase subunit F (NADH-binding)